MHDRFVFHSWLDETKQIKIQFFDSIILIDYLLYIRFQK